MSLFFIIGYTIKNSYKIQEQLLTDSLKNKAIAIFDLIVDMRHWNAQYDGVYVKSEKLEPNQYLNPNSIKSEKGETMVWVNPAFMTRQISDIASLRDGFKLKITSNKLINKNNAPDADEKKILDHFDKNPNIPYWWEIKDNEFKFMGALQTEQACLVCHAKQGYKVGDIRGGISVTFDVTKEFEQLNEINKDKEQTIIFLIIAAIGVIITLLIHENTRRINEQKISKLNESLEIKVKELDDFNQTLHNKVKIEIEKQREKENLLIQQSKLAALGEMIGNIAHQWRQPLSLISTIASGIKVQVEFGLFNEKDVIPDMDNIIKQTTYLSDTIDDFRNFIKNSNEKGEVLISNVIQKALSILNASIVNNNIVIILSTKEDINILGYENQLIQALINILNNAKDALKENVKNSENKLIFIETKNIQNGLVLNIKDNAGGIPENVIGKIFEPYFTTKHKSIGTGIGLSITDQIITKHHNANITASNETYEYEGKTYTGACFTITFNTLKELVQS